MINSYPPHNRRTRTHTHTPRHTGQGQREQFPSGTAILGYGNGVILFHILRDYEHSCRLTAPPYALHIRKMAQKVQWCTMKRLADLSVPSQPCPAGWLTYSRQSQKIARIIQCTTSLGNAPRSRTVTSASQCNGAQCVIASSHEVAP